MKIFNSAWDTEWIRYWGHGRAAPARSRELTRRLPDSFHVAEWVRFELTLRWSTNDLANRPLKPLEYHSVQTDKRTRFCLRPLFDFTSASVRLA